MSRTLAWPESTIQDAAAAAASAATRPCTGCGHPEQEPASLTSGPVR